MTDFDARRKAFGTRLRQLRADAGLTGQQLAEQCDWLQSKVSKLETGKQTASDGDLVAWSDATDMPLATFDELQHALDDLRVDYATWRRQLRAGSDERQRKATRDWNTASRIRIVEFGVVPGIVQIPGYAREVLTAHADLHGLDRDIDAAVAARMGAQAALYDTTKSIDVLIAEAALRYPVATPTVMAAQIDRLVPLLGLPHVRFGMLPLDQRLPWMPMHGYWIVDDQAMVENVTAEITINDPDELAAYRTLTDKLWTVAVEGDDARALLLRLARDYAERRGD